MRVLSLGLLVAALFLAPGAAAWRPAAAPALEPSAVVAHWALDAGHSAASPHGRLSQSVRVACVLGDVNRDGYSDLLVALKDRRSGLTRLTLLAGPSYQQVIWSQQRSIGASLACAADAQRDGTADPLVRASLDGREESASLNGVTGEPLLTVNDAASATSVALPGGFARVERSTNATLSPAGADLFIHVSLEATTVTSGVPGALTLSSDSTSLKIELLDARGQTRATLSPAVPARAVLAVGAAPSAAGTRVFILSTLGGAPSDQAATQVATTSAYSETGALLWSRDHNASLQLAVMLPQAGDLNGDGVNDVIVETVPATLHAPDGSVLEILSGADGSTLLARSPASGVDLALPFGRDARGSDVVLVMHQEDGAPTVSVDAVDQSGPIWRVEFPASAVPVNERTDPYTGDATGFSDLTGDGVPDLAVLSDPTHLEVIDGASGERLWRAPVPPDSRVEPVPAPSGGDDLLVYSPSPTGDGFTLTRRDGATGAEEWSSTGREGRGDAHVQPIPSRDGKTPDDLLFTVDPPANGTGDGTDAPSGHGAVYVVDGGGGGSTWTAPLDSDTPSPPPLESTHMPGGHGTAAFSADLPLHPPTWVLIAAGCVAVASVGVGALALRRMK